MDNNNNGGFSYTYSAKDQDEIRRIREKYTPRTEKEDKMERLRRLDASVSKKAQAVSLVIGVIGTLILGCGMSLAMTELYAALGMTAGAAMAVGIPIGIVGIILVALAYPAYTLVIRRERERIAPEVLRLTEELMK
ncbi:MAG: hypothetical protein IKJ04_08865 [Clostridia bacterium]|nr:hypothetical protein [Clostridia bacterium]